MNYTVFSLVTLVCQIGKKESISKSYFKQIGFWCLLIKFILWKSEELYFSSYLEYQLQVSRIVVGPSQGIFEFTAKTTHVSKYSTVIWWGWMIYSLRDTSIYVYINHMYYMYKYILFKKYVCKYK